MVDLVVCDGAPDVTGLHDIDEYIQAELLISVSKTHKALKISIKLLITGGTFLGKIFRGRDVSLMVAQMKVYFKSVVIVKPAASRDSSIEAFILCRDFKGLDSMQVDQTISAKQSEQINLHVNNSWNDVRKTPGAIADFIACGDLNGLDADFTYELDEGYISLEPVQEPINPPYKQFMEQRHVK